MVEIYIYIYNIYYIENFYMFCHLIMAIFRLYMKHLVNTYTSIYIYIYMGYLYGEGGGGKVVGTCGMHGGFILLPSYV